jgi:hypothetical protein
MANRGTGNAHLADNLIRRLPLPTTGNKVHYYSEVAGFGVRVTAAGARSFILNYYTVAGRERRHTIGGWPTHSSSSRRPRESRSSFTFLSLWDTRQIPHRANSLANRVSATTATR